MTRLLKEVPEAAPYRAQLESLFREHAELKAENERLQDELAWFIPKWDTLDGDAVRTLEYLSRVERGHPQEIAGANQVNIQIVESYLVFLLKLRFVHAVDGSEAHFRISDKGRRYLHDRGLLAA
jgi:hypothetical protein